MASTQPELGQTAYTGSAGSNFSHLVQFHSCAKLAWIQSGWPGQVLDKLIWSGSTPVCKNHWAQFVATGLLPVSHFQTRLHSSMDGLAHSVKTSPDLIWFWLTVSGFRPLDLVQKQAGMQK